jgi:zinc transporter ZupT
MPCRDTAGRTVAQHFCSGASDVARLLGNTRRRVNWFIWGLIVIVLAILATVATWFGPALTRLAG